MFTYEKTENSTPIRLIVPTRLEEVLAGLPKAARNWVGASRFQAKAGEYCLIPDEEGLPALVLVGLVPDEGLLWSLAALPASLPEGDYHLEGDWADEDISQAALGWGLGSYRFEQFRKAAEAVEPRLYIGSEAAYVNAVVDSISLVRNLVNTPANHMMPQDLEAVMQLLADKHDAELTVVKGNELLEENFPAIHAVGRASVHAPRLLELNWGDDDDDEAPLITLVGKGVCFDSGGLDIKSSGNMRLMKKDMGGAAHVLGLANLIMQLELPVNLQVLIPAVENAISGDAFRPGDVLATRLGKTVEVDNTDAEGRLVLCDALAYAAEFDPDVVIDFATLTGAARVALGTEIPVFFCNDRSLMQQLQIASTTSGELIWNMPLHKPYFEKLKSNVADMTNSGDAYGGAITAALFLNEFVPSRIPWAHFDVMAWNLRARPGRPVGGEAMGLLSVFEYIDAQFCAEDA
ncbi:MAG: leucyl aminopeptidase family protein [Thiolinea sp.]